MIYGKLLEIQTALTLTGLYREERIYLGEAVSVGADQDDYLVIKSGNGDIRIRQVTAIVHLMSKLYDDLNIEKKVSQYLDDVLHTLGKINGLQPVFYTTDADVFLPIGREFSPAPPLGGFRIDVEFTQTF